MATYTLRDCDPGAIAAAKQRARDAGTTLDVVLRAYLTAYASGTTAQQAGGRARADALSADDRTALARHAALTRWRHR